jgi:membrane glycosyltransferase
MSPGNQDRKVRIPSFAEIVALVFFGYLGYLVIRVLLLHGIVDVAVGVIGYLLLAALLAPVLALLQLCFWLADVGHQSKWGRRRARKQREREEKRDWKWEFERRRLAKQTASVAGRGTTFG